MANDSTDKKTVFGVELLNQFKELSTAALAKFREYHDLCVKSGFISEKTVQEMNMCATGYRMMALSTVKIAKTVSIQWIDSILLFYKNISGLNRDKIVEHLKTLGGQGKQLGLVFKVIAAWSRDLAGNLHKVSVSTYDEAESCLEGFKRELEYDQQRIREARENIKSVVEEYKAAVERAEEWSIASIFGIPSHVIPSSAPIKEAKERLAREVQKFEATETKEQKAEMILKIVTTLIKIFNGMETISEGMAIFWTMESNTFLTQGQKMMADETHFPKILLEKAAIKDIESWEKAKSSFDEYVHIMSPIISQSVYITDAKPVPTQDFEVGKLDLKLSIPCSVDLKKIMAGVSNE